MFYDFLNPFSRSIFNHIFNPNPVWVVVTEVPKDLKKEEEPNANTEVPKKGATQSPDTLGPTVRPQNTNATENWKTRALATNQELKEVREQLQQARDTIYRQRLLLSDGLYSYTWNTERLLDWHCRVQRELTEAPKTEQTSNNKYPIM